MTQEQRIMGLTKIVALRINLAYPTYQERIDAALDVAEIMSEAPSPDEMEKFLIALVTSCGEE